MRFTNMLAGAALVMLTAGAAQALPVQASSSLGDAAPLFEVRAGCGFGAHRGPYGGCRLNRGPRGQMRRMMTGAPRGCPPRMYRGPRGVCRYR